MSFEDFLPHFGRYLLFVSFLFYVESSPGLVLELRVHLLHHHCWPTTIMIFPEISGVFDMGTMVYPTSSKTQPSEVQAYRILGHPDVCAATSSDVTVELWCLMAFFDAKSALRPVSSAIELLDSDEESGKKIMSHTLASLALQPMREVLQHTAPAHCLTAK